MVKRIGVVGAGMAGISCARRLKDLGHDVTVFDKGRALGGRLSTRETNGFAFDHGAPSLQADRPPFQSFLARLADIGAAAPFPDGTFVGCPAMNRLLSPVCEDLAVEQNHEVTAIVPSRAGWSLTFKEGPPDRDFAAVALCIPAPQAAALVQAIEPDWLDQLDACTYAPSLTAMVAFGAEAFDVDGSTGTPSDADGSGAAGGTGVSEGKPPAHSDAPQPIALQLRNDKRPERPDHAEQWVIHATRDWSEAHLNCERDAIAQDLLAAFFEVNGLARREPGVLRGHRWRYARVTNAIGRSHLYDPVQRLGYASDACLGANAEHAFESGLMLAQTLHAALPNPG